MRHLRITISTLLLLLPAVSGANPQVQHQANQLPVPAANWVAPGVASWSYHTGSGNKVDMSAMQIQQHVDKGIFNWSSFNIGRDNSVEFQQPDSSSVALNRIHDVNPSKILGSLTANGSVYLINQNGIIFGKDAQVNVHSLIASSLNISDEVFERGIAEVYRDRQAAFEGDGFLKNTEGEPLLFAYGEDNLPITDEDGNLIVVNEVIETVTLEGEESEKVSYTQTDDDGNIIAEFKKGGYVNSEILLEKGAEIITRNGGRVMLLGPEISNHGRIVTPDGQTVLAAGNKVYVKINESDDMRGLLVEVDIDESQATNNPDQTQSGKVSPLSGELQNLGEVVAERGNISLIGMAVNQSGRVTATSSINKNGSVFLYSRSDVQINGTDEKTIDTKQTGSVTLGEDSVTEILVELDELSKAIDTQEKIPSRVEIMGRDIVMQERAEINAKSGEVNINAVDNPSSASPTTFVADNSDIRFEMAPESKIDVSGFKNLELEMDHNLVEVELRSNELKDSPVQRNGPLRGQQVVVDVRHGTPLADVSGAVQNVARSNRERHLVGGEVNIISQGKTILHDNSTIDVSGGSALYNSGRLNTTKLIAGFTVYDISEASPERSYDGIFGVSVEENRKWGIKETHKLFGAGSLARFEESYLEGKDAGSIKIVGRNVQLNGKLLGNTVSGKWQRYAPAALDGRSWARPYDQIAKGGTLTIGYDEASGGNIDYVVPNVTFSLEKDLTNNQSPHELQLDQGIYQHGFTQLSIFSNGRVDIPKAYNLALPAGGDLDITAASITLAGSITLPGGNIELTATGNRTLSPAIDGLPSIELLEGSRIDTSGLWINDSLNFQPENNPLIISAGSVTLKAEGSVALQQGSEILANSGGWVDNTGSFTGSRGGDITLQAQASNAASVLLNGELEAHGFEHGGKLTINSTGFLIQKTGGENQTEYLINEQIEAKKWAIDPEALVENDLRLSVLIPSDTSADDPVNIAQPDVISLNSDLTALIEFIDDKYLTPEGDINAKALRADGLMLNPVFQSSADIVKPHSVVNLNDYIDSHYLSDNGEINKAIFREEGVLINSAVLDTQGLLIDEKYITTDSAIDPSKLAERDLPRLPAEFVQQIDYQLINKQDFVVNPAVLQQSSEGNYSINTNVVAFNPLLVARETVADDEIVEVQQIEGIFNHIRQFDPALAKYEIDIEKLNQAGLVINPDFVVSQKNIIDSNFFTHGGFNAYELNANYTGIEIQDVVTIRPLANNLVLQDNYLNKPSYSDLESVADIKLLPSHMRNPVDISFKLNRLSFAERDGLVHIGKSAKIETEIGANVEIISDTSVFIEGKVFAPAGNITVEVVKPENASDPFQPEKAIWLSSSASLQVPGISRLTPAELELPMGEVYDAGKISLSTERGFVVTESGSLLNVAATKDELYISGSNTDPTVITGHAGDIMITAAEGAFLHGEMSAAATDLAGSRGGKLSVVFDSSKRDAPILQNSPNAIAYPNGKRLINIVSDSEQSLIEGLEFGDSLVQEDHLRNLQSGNDQVDGTIVLPESILTASGFDSVSLKAIPIKQNGVSQIKPGSSGEIAFLDDIDLLLAQSLYLDAPVLSAADRVGVRISAPYVEMGSTNEEFIYFPEAKTGTGTLDISAQHVDLYGYASLQGFGFEKESEAGNLSAVNINSSGDIRFIGVFNEANPQLMDVVQGGLNAAGNISLSANRIYPATRSEFKFNVSGSENNSLNIYKNDSSFDVPLAAGGALHFNAPNIVNEGNILAPFGQLVLNALHELVLAPGSTTSVSGEGSIVPFGQIELGRDWVLLSGPNELRSVQESAPEKALVLDAPRIDTQLGAVVDVSGGGDLFAYEFINGPGGSRDILHPEIANDSFAILPTQASLFPAYDPIESKGFYYVPGTTIELKGNNSLPSGEFAIFPARYALLPGAYLVTPVTHSIGNRDSLLSFTPDGIPVVSGKFSFANSSKKDSMSSGFKIESGDQLRNRVKYFETTADQFFSNLSGEVEQIRLPMDAGGLQISAEQFLNLQATLRSQHVDEARGTRVDISAAELAVVDTRNSTNSGVQLLASQLNALSAESVLLGGLRKVGQDGLEIDTKAEHILLEEEIALSGAEIILTSQDELELSPGVALSGIGELNLVSKKYRFINSGAWLRVAGGDQISAETDSLHSEAGYLDIGEDATVNGQGSLAMHANNGYQISGLIETSANGSVSLSASSVALGDISTVNGESLLTDYGLVLTNSDLQEFEFAELILKSGSTLDIYGWSEIGLDEKGEIALQHLVLDSAGIRGIDLSADSILTASLIDITNTEGLITEANISNDPIAIQDYNLTLTTNSLKSVNSSIPFNQIKFTDANVELMGFNEVRFDARDEFLLSGAVNLAVDNDVYIAAKEIGTTDAANANISAAGKMQLSKSISIQRNDNTASISGRGLGSNLSLSAHSIESNLPIHLPSGSVDFSLLVSNSAENEENTSVGNIQFGSQSEVNVAGIQLDYKGVSIFTPGGKVELHTDNGDIKVENGAVFDISGAPQGGDAGKLSFFAPLGSVHFAADSLRGGAHSEFKPADFWLDASSVQFQLNDSNIDSGSTNETISSFSPLNTLLNSAADDNLGFLGVRDIRLREGNIEIQATDKVMGHDVSLAADRGDIKVNGIVDASGSEAGSIQLNAGKNLIFSPSAQLLARGLDEDQEGGEIFINTANGFVEFQGDDTGEAPLLDVSGTKWVSLYNQAGQRVTQSDIELYATSTIEESSYEVREGLAYTQNTGKVHIRAPRARIARVESDLNETAELAYTKDGRPIFFVNDSEGESTLLPSMTDSQVQDSNSIVDPKVNNAIAISQFNVDVLGASKTYLEAFQRYELAPGESLDDLASTPQQDEIETILNSGEAENYQLYFDASNFMTARSELVNQLGVDSQSPKWYLRPGIEIVASDDVELNENWDFLTWRFGENDEAGSLSIRSAGDIVTQDNAGLSDGIKFSVQNVSDFWGSRLAPDLLTAESWNYNLVAGADLASTRQDRVLQDQGSFVMLGNSMLRTGSGDIRVSAGSNIELKSDQAFIMTMGKENVDSRGTLDPITFNEFFSGITASEQWRAFFPTDGGDVTLLAGNDILATHTSQLYSEWMPRIGGDTAQWGKFPTSWGVYVTEFKQGVAALGGGNIQVIAGGDIEDLSLSLPSTATQVGENEFIDDGDSFGSVVETNEIVINSGGDLSLTIDGNLLGGSYFVAGGQADIRVDGEFQKSKDFASRRFPIFAMSDAKVSAKAVGSIALDAVVNPTMIKQDDEVLLNSGRDPSDRTYFFTYGEQSRLLLESLNGNVLFNNDSSQVMASGQMNVSSDNRQTIFHTYPGYVAATAIQGSIEIADHMNLFPTSQGNIVFIAEHDILSINNAATLSLSDSDPALLPNYLTPSDDGGLRNDTRKRFEARFDNNSTHAEIPVHINDSTPVKFVALTGDIAVRDPGVDNAVFKIYLAKNAEFYAGNDIRMLSLKVQHVDENRFTLLEAGNDFIYSMERNVEGKIASLQNGFVQVSGPGTTQIIAGGDIDLGNAEGILSLGNELNTALPNQGANISLVSGVTFNEVSVDDFLQSYLAKDSDYDELVQNYIELFNSDPQTDTIKTWLDLPQAKRRELAFAVFFEEIKSAGIAATDNTSPDFGDYSSGFTAVDQLFSKQNNAKQSNNLTLLSSQIITQQGGDISLIVPSGKVDAGASSTGSLSKGVEKLGIKILSEGDIKAFSNGDFLVNESRVYTAGGGSILVWSNANNVDAGRGAKTAVSVPDLLLTYNADGFKIEKILPGIAGSGIRTASADPEVDQGNVYLFAPNGEINAGDAGIGGKDVVLGAPKVVGADNIDVGGAGTGVPLPDVGGFSVGLVGVSNLASSANEGASESVGASIADENESATPAADQAMSFLEVFVIEFGDDTEEDNEDNSS